MADAGYSGTPLVKKLGIKSGLTLALVGAPEGFERLLKGLPKDVRPVRGGTATADLILWWPASARDLASRIRAIELPPFDPLNRRAAELREAGHHVISLGQAVPFFGPPAAALDAAECLQRPARVRGTDAELQPLAVARDMQNVLAPGGARQFRKDERVRALRQAGDRPAAGLARNDGQAV